MSRSSVSQTTPRRQVIDILNDALSPEYHSFIGHALGSSPYVRPEWESDLKTLEAIRDDENASARALLVQLGRYRAGPTLRAFHLWKEDLNFLALEWLVIRAAEEAAKNLARVEALVAQLPDDDAELAATFESLLRAKREHVKLLAPMAEQRKQTRDARRATNYAATAVNVKGLGGPPPAATKAAAPAAAPPAKKGGGPALPKLPGGFKLPPGGPKPPGSPKPPGAPKPPAAAKPSAPPLPPGMKLPSGPPKAPGAPPSAPTPSAPAAPAAPAEAPAADAAPSASGDGPGWPPLPPGFQLPPKR